MPPYTGDRDDGGGGGPGGTGLPSGWSVTNPGRIDGVGNDSTLRLEAALADLFLQIDGADGFIDAFVNAGRAGLDVRAQVGQTEPLLRLLDEENNPQLYVRPDGSMVVAVARVIEFGEDGAASLQLSDNGIVLQDRNPGAVGFANFGNGIIEAGASIGQTDPIFAGYEEGGDTIFAVGAELLDLGADGNFTLKYSSTLNAIEIQAAGGQSAPQLVLYDENGDEFFKITQDGYLAGHDGNSYLRLGDSADTDADLFLQMPALDGFVQAFIDGTIAALRARAQPGQGDPVIVVRDENGDDVFRLTPTGQIETPPGVRHFFGGGFNLPTTEVNTGYFIALANGSDGESAGMARLVSAIGSEGGSSLTVHASPDQTDPVLVLKHEDGATLLRFSAADGAAELRLDHLTSAYALIQASGVGGQAMAKLYADEHTGQIVVSAETDQTDPVFIANGLDGGAVLLVNPEGQIQDGAGGNAYLQLTEGGDAPPSLFLGTAAGNGTVDLSVGPTKTQARIRAEVDQTDSLLLLHDQDNDYFNEIAGTLYLDTGARVANWGLYSEASGDDTKFGNISLETRASADGSAFYSRLIIDSSGAGKLTALVDEAKAQLEMRAHAGQTSGTFFDLLDGAGDLAFSVQADGALWTNQAAAASVAVGTLANKLPIYDATGTLLGYVPIYDAIT